MKHMILVLLLVLFVVGYIGPPAKDWNRQYIGPPVPGWVVARG